jgi:hypothetical protein
VAEVYWGLEGALLDQGFDYCYDKGLYDRLRSGDVQALKSHLGQGWKDPTRAVRFIENHDEPRGASTFEPGRHQCAAVTTYLSPGMRLFHEGQLEGHRIRVPMQLVRAPEEPVNPALAGFYGELVALLKEPSYRRGRCRLLDLATDWPGSAAGDAIVAWSWDGPDGERRVIVVNPSDSECEARMLLPRSGLNVRGLRLRGGPDLALRPIEAAVQQEGVLLLRLGAWEFCVLEWTP